MDIVINVTNQKLHIATNLKSFVEGSQNFVKFRFNLGEEWSGLTTYAQFGQDGSQYNLYLDSENCVYLPHEIKAGTCTLLLYGSGGDVIATTNYLTLTIDSNSLASDASSTDITPSLYQQLVNRVNGFDTALETETRRATAAETTINNTLALKANQSQVDQMAIQLDQLVNSEVVQTQIEEAVAAELEEYLQSGQLAEMTIGDGTLSREKVDTSFEATLQKADTAMQPSVYDPQNLRVDIFSYAKGRADTVQANLNAVITELQDGYKLTNTLVYTKIGDAIRGAVTLANTYAQALLADYKAFTIEFVNELPQYGQAHTFYLVPHGSGYEKWWWIDDGTVAKWDQFGSSTTEVVTQLPTVGDEDVDYILFDGSGYIYYKYINGVWEMIAGSADEMITPAYNITITGSGSPTESVSASANNGAYYLDTDTMTSYVSDGTTWTQVAVIAEPSAVKDYYIKIKGGYSHYRYVTDKFVDIGAGYTNDEIDAMVAAINSAINAQNSDIAAIDARVDNLGNMVSDVTEGTTGIIIHYKDGTTKSVATKDASVVVEDVIRTEDGIRISYTDGNTEDIEISGGGGGGTTSGSASITRVTDASTQCVYGDNCPIEFTFNAIDSAGDMVGDGTATWFVNNVRKTQSVVHQGSNTFDIGSYLNVGTNTVKISVSVDTGGETPTVTTKTWSVNAINMYLTWDYDDTTINEGDTFTIRWTPYGDLSKVTHIVIDGTEVETSTTTRSGVQQSVTLARLSHGSHLVRLYITATVNNTAITSDSVYHDMIFVESGNNTPVISCSIDTNTMVQYNTLPIPVVIYTPNSLTSNAVLSVDGVEAATWTGVDRTMHYWNYTPSTFGAKVLTITSGTTTKTINLTVTELEIDNEEVTGYAFRMKASDIAGNDALRSWNSNGITATFSNNFDWNNGGIKTELDSHGNTVQYICVKAGTTMTIGYELFGNDAKVAGKNVKIIFKTTNCRDYDAVWLDCMSDGIGIQLGANEGLAKSEQNTVAVEYAEGSYIEFEYDIYPDNLNSSAGNAMRYIQTYIDGVLSSTNIYAANDNFTQTTKKNIVIGSEDCDVYIYMVKCYENYMTRENHIVNFIADAPNAVEMVDRYNRNDVLAQNGEIDYQKLATQNPNCRVHLWDIPRMTQNKIKKDPVSGCSYQQIYMAGDESDQITAENVTIGVQGTSSINYITSAANTDGRFNDGFTDGNGNHIAGYAMSENSIPVNFFNTKVNVASCENVNNMCIAEWYDSHQPYRTGARVNVENGRDCMEHHIGVQFIRDRHEDNEPASAALFTDVDPDGNNYHMYAICNMGNSKDNSSVFHDANNPLECCLETKDNNSGYCMMTTPLTQEALDTEDYFEFRYPKSPTQAMKDAFINFVNWFSSLNPSAATGNALASPVTYSAYTFKGTSSWDANEQNEVLAGLTISDYAGIYTHDTYNYRIAKLLDECEDHLVMDSIVYHYVFVEQHAMVDNVCKNTFWGTDDLIHWHLCKNYDNDTADGNDNVGKLTIPFGSEGMDSMTTGRDVFNGKMNIYWQFVYALYPARRLMWQNREAVGTWNADAYLQFATGWQNYIPERVFNQDYWYKYLRPYEQNADTTYISMLEGGKKAHQREGFVRNNLTYMASQYTGTYCTSDSVTLRAYTPTISDTMTEAEKEVVRRTLEVVPSSATFQIMLYNKGYVVVEVGSAMQRIKADKGVYYTVTFADSVNFQETVINVHGASNVRAIGDLSSIYVGWCNFAKATKLRSLTVGSNLEGYTNPNLTSIGFESNPMLEELYIQHCPNANTTLDLSGCQALRTLDVRGSGFTGINFAVGGLIDDAKLCSPASLTMRDLYYLTDANLSLESYTSLTTLRFENTPNINSLNIVTQATNLSRARILGIDWELATTSVLNQLLGLMGLDENDHNTDVSVVTGEAYVSGAIRNQELLNYNTAWPNLTVTYESENLVQQYLVTYVNADDNHTVLYSYYVDRGESAPDPYYNGWINEPTIDPTAQYSFKFGTITNDEYVEGSGWDDITSPVLAPRTVTAVYTPSVRRYTVTWYSRAGLPLETQTGEYGSCLEYNGDIPTRNDEEGSYIYNYFTGWDKSTGYITEDLDVYAVWDRTELPAVGTDLSTMSRGQIFAVCTAGLASNYFEDKDHFDMTLGCDFNFSNVTSQTLVENRFFDGTTHYDTNIKLFDASAPSFTIAIDFEFLNNCEQNGTLVSCFEESGNEGFRLRYSSNADIQWGDKNVNVGYQDNRNIVVLRHIKGSRNLFIYAFNMENTTYALEPIEAELVRTRDTVSDAVLSFGAVRFISDGGHDYYGKGWIHWCKIWYADLGATLARKLASWPHETLRMEFTGANRYRLAGSTSTRANGSFLANNELTLLRRMNPTNTNAGGWDDCEMREFLNTRFYNALDYGWQSIIKKVKIQASAGNQSTEILTSEDYIYLAANREVGGNTTVPYINEGEAISFFTENKVRIKFNGIIIPDGSSFISDNTDPTVYTTYTVKEGDIWIHTGNSSNGYIYVPASKIENHTRIGSRIIATNTENISASDGGLWVGSNVWWERSPYASYSTSFMSVYTYGSPNYSYNASYTHGVVVGFSI